MDLFRLIDRLDDALAQDLRLGRAMRRLPAAVGTAEWPMAEHMARVASGVAVRRALWQVLRSMMCPAAQEAGTAPDSPLMRCPS
jgi:hypothetical protein